MIPRYQTVLFFILLAASVVMGVALWQLRNREHQRMLAGEQSTPTQAPLVAPMVQATLMVASDVDDTLMTQELALPLPQSPNERARAILNKLLDLYAAPDALHAVPGGGASAVLQVFLMPVNAGKKADAPGGASGEQSVMVPDAGAPAGAASDAQNGAQLAVIDLAGTFADNHPSGIETESLTVLSICATLHANLPHVTEVRFLVDGQTRETLAGHADLTRTYLTAEAMPAPGAQQ